MMSKHIHKLKNTTIARNIVALGVIQLTNYIIPIILIPIVVRILGVEAFGRASYAQNIVSYLTIIVNFGFEYSGTQDIALNRNNPNALRRIFWTITRFKVLLLIFSGSILTILYFYFLPIHNDLTLYLYAFLVNVGFVFLPNWYFLGVEKMGKMALFNLAIKLLSACCIIALIHHPNDYRIYPLATSISYIIVGLSSFIYVIKKYNLYYERTLDNKVLKKGAPIFLNNLFATIYSNCGLTLLGIYSNEMEVGLYAGVNKVIMAITILANMPISYAIFPQMSQKFSESTVEGWHFFQKCLIRICILGGFVSLSVWIFAPFIVSVFLGNEFANAYHLLRLCAPLPLLIMLASTFTIQGLYGLQKQSFAPYIGGFIAIVTTLLSCFLVQQFNAAGAIWGYITAEILEIILTCGIVLNYKE